MRFDNWSLPSIGDETGVAAIMRQVLLALIPGIAVLIWYFGLGVVSNLVLATAFTLLLEAGMLGLRRQPIRIFLGDYSAAVTGVLLALALPPLSPWWLVLVASFFAIVVAKHLYGGLGNNPFNPAMVGYAVVLVSFPVPMTSWIAPAGVTGVDLGIADQLAVLLGGSLSALDGVTAATPLDAVKAGVAGQRMLSELYGQPIFGLLGGHGSELASLMFLGGGLWIVSKGITSWRIPAATLASLSSVAALFWILDAETYASPVFHLFSGATMLGAFFIATDPVSSCTTPRGQLLFGLGVGILIYVIRTWGAYPDGVAFAVLLMNLCAPTIDHYTQPRVFGQERT